MSASPGSIDALQILLSANAHGPVIKAIIETLGDGAVDEFADAVRRLDQRVSGALRTVDVIATEDIEPLSKKDARSPRKQLERIVRGLIRRNARSIIGVTATQQRNGIWRTALAASALDIIRTHGAVDVLAEWVALDHSRTKIGRPLAHQKTAKRNRLILDEATQSRSETQRGRAGDAALRANLKGYSDVTSDTARGVIRRRKPPKK